MIVRSCSLGRLPSLQIKPDNVSFGVFLDCKAYNFVAILDFDFFAFPWRWEEFREDPNFWFRTIGFKNLFAIFVIKSNLSAFTSWIIKFFWTLNSRDLFWTLEICFGKCSSIKFSKWDWVCFTMEREFDALRILPSIYFVYVRVDLLQVEALHFK